MFIREGLLDPLSSALLNVMTSRGELAADMNRKIIQILLVFCQVSQSDIHVRNALGTRKVIRRKCNTVYAFLGPVIGDEFCTQVYFEHANC